MIKRLLLSILSLSVFTIAHEVTLNKGWNLVGTPDRIDEANISLESKESLWSYENGQWKLKTGSQSEGKSSFELLDKVEAGSGFWIFASREKNITLPGSAGLPKSWKKGWNLVSPVGNGWDIERKMRKEENISAIWSYKDSEWHVGFNGARYAGGFKSLGHLNLYRGAWVYIAQPSMWRFAGYPLYMSGGSFGHLLLDSEGAGFHVTFAPYTPDVDIKIAINLHRKSNDTQYAFAIGPFRIGDDGSLLDKYSDICARKGGDEECHKRVEITDMIKIENSGVTLLSDKIASYFNKSIPSDSDEYSIEIFVIGIDVSGSETKTFETLSETIVLQNAHCVRGTVTIR